MDQLEKFHWVAYIEVMAERAEVPIYIAARAGRMIRNGLTTKTLT
jgi:hypothetical protein